MRIGFWRSKTRKASEITSEQFTLDRMPRGTDTHVLTAKGVGVNPAYEAVAAGKQIATGTYTGTDVDNRQIATGFKCSCVILTNGNVIEIWIAMPDATVNQNAAITSLHTDLLLHATDGFVVDQDKANDTNYDPYYYWAISE